MQCHQAQPGWWPDRTFRVLAIGVGVLAGACGDDGGSAPTSPPPTTPAPPPAPPPPPPPPTCTVGLVLRAGDSCTYPGTSQTLTVNADGSASLGPFTSGRSINIASGNLVLVASRQSDGSWIIERVGAESLNRAPITVGSISNQTLTEGGDPRTVDVSANFADPDGDTLSYAVMTSDPTIVVATISGNIVTLRALREGAVTVTLTATDSGGLSVNQSFRVTVRAALPPPTPTGLRVANVGVDFITWSWDDVDGAIGYAIQVSSDETFNSQDPITPTIATTFTADSLPPATTLSARVAAAAGSLETPLVSAWSAHVTATTTSGTTGAGICLNSRATPSGSTAGLVRDCGILLEARDELQGTARLNWSAELAIGSWDGVQTTDDGVIEVRLSSRTLTGSIPSSLGNLTNLEYLSLTRNHLAGTIPNSLGDLANLEVLALGDNDLRGNIPAGLRHLTELRELYLWGNSLTGTIPSSLGNLTNLAILQLSGNNLTGRIPDSLGNLTNLRILSLFQNTLTGTVPNSLGNLTNLELLSLSRNRLTGTIPSFLANLTNLEVLSLSGNNLRGSIPLALGDLTKLRELYLWGNDLTGAIPDVLGNLTNLARLQLQENRLTGCIPSTLERFLSSINPQQGGMILEVCGEDPGAVTDTFRAGDRIPNFPTGPPNIVSGASFSLSGGVVTITLRRDGYVEYDDYRYTCNASQCRIVDGLVTAGEITRTEGGGGAENRAPRAVGRIPDQTLTAGGSAKTLDVSGNFEDPDGDTLSYAARSSRSSVVRVSTSGSEVTLTPVAEGGGDRNRHGDGPG